MMNLLSYVGMNLQSEVCMWTLMGIVRTIFDATLFKVNSNLKEVWLMEMPEELMMSIQRIIRTVISGVMLVQCFTVHAYLASYIVLLYPVFLEERPTLVLPWLLLAAVRKLLCELSSLALGLGICVLLGPSKPPCVKFVLTKIVSIMGSLYMWMLVLNYYHFLKIAAAFKTIPAALASSSIEDYGLELAIRRRKTKSLFNEQMLRQKLVTNYYKTAPFNSLKFNAENLENKSSSSTQLLPLIKHDIYQSTILNTNKDSSESGNVYDLFGVDISIPRDSDRILEQFVLMLLRVSNCLKNKEDDSVISLVGKSQPEIIPNYLDCSTDIENDTSVSVHNRGSATSSYITDFPQIFQKQDSDSLLFQSNERAHDIKQNENNDNSNITKTSFKAVSFCTNSNKEVTIEIEKSISYKTVGNKCKVNLERKLDSENNKHVLNEEFNKCSKTSSTITVQNLNNDIEKCQPKPMNQRKYNAKSSSKKVRTRSKQINKLIPANRLSSRKSSRTKSSGSLHNALQIKRSNRNLSQNESEEATCSNVMCDNITYKPSTSAISRKKDTDCKKYLHQQHKK